MRPRHSSDPIRMLYAEDLARRLHAMEQGFDALDAVAYRLYARRMRRALAGLSQAQLTVLLKQHVALREARANQYFAEHGHFEGAAEVAPLCAELMGRWRSGVTG